MEVASDHFASGAGATAGDDQWEKARENYHEAGATIRRSVNIKMASTQQLKGTIVVQRYKPSHIRNNACSALCNALQEPGKLMIFILLVCSHPIR